MLVERLISCCKEVRLLPFFFQDSPVPQRTHARAHTHPFSPVSFDVLSDRDRTFTAQCRAHAAPIRIPSRRAGEEGWQDPEGGKHRCGEWDKLTLNRRRRQIQIPMYPTRIHTHTLFLFFSLLFTVIFLVLLVDQSILEEGNHTGFSRTLSRKSKKTSVSVAYMHSPRRCAAPVIHSFLCSLSFLLPIMSIQRTCPCPTRHHARSYSSALLFFPSGLSFPIMPPARPAPPPRSPHQSA